MAVYIGTSGWSYDHWQNVLYPNGLPAVKRLDYYTSRYRTVEINSTFYRWPGDAAFVRWRQRLPDGFLFTVKAPRGLTHGARLYSPEKWLATVKRGMNCLEGKKGILLVQLPPEFQYDHARLAYFLDCLPSELKIALEFRHASWHQEAVFGLLEEKGVAYCVMSGAKLPCILRVTAPFVYARLHGPDTEHLYGGSYSDESLWWWKERIEEWQNGGRDVFVYFNNDGSGNAVRNADTLRNFLGV